MVANFKLTFVKFPFGPILRRLCTRASQIMRRGIWFPRSLTKSRRIKLIQININLKSQQNIRLSHKQIQCPLSKIDLSINCNAMDFIFEVMYTQIEEIWY